MDECDCQSTECDCIDSEFNPGDFYPDIDKTRNSAKRFILIPAPVIVFDISIKNTKISMTES